MESNFSSEEGRLHNFWVSGTMVFGMSVVIANLKVLIISNDHCLLSFFMNFGSMLVYLLTLAIISRMKSS